MKKSFLFACVILTVVVSNAQKANTYLNNYVQPAPNAAALGKYVDFPVSYYTGVPDVSIPIYTLKDGAATVPVSISYHASGIRVSEVASWVGLGWALNAGGIIIRTVCGAPDEGCRKTSTSYGPKGYYRDFGIQRLPLLPHPVGGQIPGNNEQLMMQTQIVPAMASGGMDGEPDIFTFNFNGYSGKFVFDENQTPRLLTDADIRIEPNFSSSNFNSWLITTPDGTKYYFGENNMHEVTSPHSTLSGDDPDSQLPSSWYLTRIVYPDTRDVVYFNYTSESYTYFDLGPESRQYSFVMASHSDPPSEICPNYIIKNSLRTTVTGLRLTSIQTGNFNIVFEADNQRQDISDYTTRPNQLDSIKIFTSTGECISRFGFQYSYFQSSLSTNAVLDNPSMPVGSSDAKRLKLLSLTEISGDGSITKPSYLFQYQDAYQLPRRLSFDQDHWGYSNNSSGNANSYFTPGIDLTPMCSSGGANRDPAWPQMQAATLKSVTDPLGVNTAFEFEPDSADNYYPARMIGGLRIHRIINTEGVTGKQTVRKFMYAGGTLFKTPVYIFPLKNEFYVGSQNIISGYIGYGNQFVLIGYLKQSQSIVPLQDVQGNHIGYTRVKEIYGDNGEGGSKDYVYYINHAPSSSSRLDLSNYASLQSVQTTYYGTHSVMVGNGHFNDIAPGTLQYYNGFDAGSYYPLVPEQFDSKRGKLLSEITYDSEGSMLRKIVNSYKVNVHESYLIRGFKVYSTPFQVISDRPLSSGNNDALTFYKLHTGNCQLILSTVSDYKDGKEINNSTSYLFESPNHTQPTCIQTTNSQGDVLLTKTYYSFDYLNNATTDGIFAKMKTRNLLLPVATRVWKNNQLVAGTITEYKDFSANNAETLINPSRVYSLEVSNPLSSAQAGENIDFTNQFSSLIPNNYFKEKASFNINSATGKIIEQRLVNDKNQALIWDSKYSLPLAQVDNAFYPDIAYCSFETAETGNWIFNSSSIVSDATAPTGFKAYSVSGGISVIGLTSSRKYILSYWQKSGAGITVIGGTRTNNITGRTLNSWTYHQLWLTGTTSITISGSGNIDEVRLHPADANMTTYTYDALMRLIAQNSPNNTITYYDYDSMNRLIDVKDQYGNIIKTFEYNYGRNSR